jgi:general secretion pathway protein C
MQDDLTIRGRGLGSKAASLVLMILLAGSGAYWLMQALLSKPAQEEVPPQNESAPVDIRQAGKLFGGEGMAAVTSGNFRLMGVVVARDTEDSLAILSIDGKPAQSYRVNKEIASGVVLKEVHDKYVVLSEDGDAKRLALPEPARGSVTPAAPVTPALPNLAGVPPAPPQEAPEQVPNKE